MSQSDRFINHERLNCLMLHSLIHELSLSVSIWHMAFIIYYFTGNAKPTTQHI